MGQNKLINCHVTDRWRIWIPVRQTAHQISYFGKILCVLKALVDYSIFISGLHWEGDKEWIRGKDLEPGERKAGEGACYSNIVKSLELN